MMAEGKIIDVAVKKTSHSIHLPKQSHQTKSQEFPEHFHSFTDIIFQFKFRLEGGRADCYPEKFIEKVVEQIVTPRNFIVNLCE
jgi:hypothetical protein